MRGAPVDKRFWNKSRLPSVREPQFFLGFAGKCLKNSYAANRRNRLRVRVLSKLGILATCYRATKRELQKVLASGDAGTKCRQKCWPECWHRRWQVVLSLCFPERAHIFASICASTSANPFWEFFRFVVL